MYMYNQQIIRVNGEPGARAYQMLPNSSALLLDENQPLIWFATTDGAGYKTITPYTITKYEPEPEPGLKDLLDRISKLEEKINEPNHTEFTENKPDKRGQLVQHHDAK